MRTDMQMLKTLDEEYYPQKRGIASPDEIHLIEATLELNESYRDERSLRNLRDMTVVFYTDIKESGAADLDKMSAITAVIDRLLFQMGVSV